MATDLAANWYAVYGIQHSNFAAQPDLQRLTVFAASVLGTTPSIRRHLTNRDDVLPRRLRPVAPTLVRPDRSARLALTFLAFAGLVGPAWVLREQAASFLGGAGHRLAVAAPDADPPHITSGH